MERTTTVEVFARDEETFYLVVEPSSAVKGLTYHLQAQQEYVRLLANPTIGDVGVNLMNGRSLEEVLGSHIHISGRY